ncbi:colanic acid biosynthesis protein [Posidoniimonas polymericola]|uniref:Colanic acid biosynthesis protein n=1 Tax=Posidoniimonas polymericola TaxID=2528002 RepID=A0A5C5YED7_9BACT|nr:polysaccharide pyruvyl transferase family protein [Posidoniimonas polymericola]TWT73710.1 colanic acid biosynthesis protein [Posidoniimonas polymericola]
MSIVLSGCNGFRNRGVEALIAPSVAELHKRFPGGGVAVLSGQPAFDETRDVDATFVLDPFIGKVRSLPVRRVGAGIAPRVFRTEAKAINAIRAADAVIASGGDNFSSDYGDFRMHLEPLKIAQKTGKATFMLAQSVGPFKSDEHRDHFCSVAKNVSLITLRESRSYDYVINELGLPADRVHLTADPAFLLNPVGEERVHRLLRRYGVDPAAPYVTIAMSRGIARFPGLDTSGANAAQVHLAVLGELVTHALDELNAQVLLVPHVQETLLKNNDLVLAEEIVDAMEDDRVRVAWGDHSAADYKGLIASASLNIAERMHAAIAGVSTATPTMVVRYSVKADGIIGDLLGENAREDGAIIPFEEYLEDEGRVAVATLQQAWENRDKIRATLSGKLPEVRRLSESNYDLFQEVLSSRGRV